MLSPDTPATSARRRLPTLPALRARSPASPRRGGASCPSLARMRRTFPDSRSPVSEVVREPGVPAALHLGGDTVRSFENLLRMMAVGQVPPDRGGLEPGTRVPRHTEIERRLAGDAGRLALAHAH